MLEDVPLDLLELGLINVDNAYLGARPAYRQMSLHAFPAPLEAMPLQTHCASFVQLDVLLALIIHLAQAAKKDTSSHLIAVLKVAPSLAQLVLQI